MNLDSTEYRAGHTPKPRTCGDEPEKLEEIASSLNKTPHMRG